MMKCTNNTEGCVLPQTRPCSTATTIGYKRDGTLEKHRRVWWHDTTEHDNFISDTNSKHSFQWETATKIPQSPGETNSYLSLGGGGNSVSGAEDDETICSSRLFSLHNHNPDRLKEQQRRREAEEQAAASKNRILCPAGTIIGDILEEVEGTFDDAVESFRQVWYAFSITPQDIDVIADVIHDAEDELTEIEVDRLLGQVRDLEERL